MRRLRNIFAAVVLLALVAIFVMWQPSRAPANDAVQFSLDEEGRESMIIRSELIKTLAPHEHKDLDSIIDQEHGEIVGLAEGPYRLERDVWINGFKWEVENAPIETLHHLVFTREDTPAPLCPNGFTDKEEIITIGSDTFVNEFSFPPQYGIHLPKGTPLDLETVLHNPYAPFGPGGTYENVRVKLTLFFHESGKEYKPVRLVRLSVEDPACTPTSSTFAVPANTLDFVKKMDSPMSSYTFKRSATILLLGTHTHGWDGGGAIVTYLNDKKIFEAIPRRKNKDPWSWATPSKLLELRVKAGDTLSFTSEEWG